MSDRPWAIVLAGGEGTRLRALARDAQGAPAPKQFCPLGGMRPPLAQAIARADGLVPKERVVVSVIEAHRRWWSVQLAGREPPTIASQPLPRGTATGILLPLLRILARDPGARVIILPADHAVEDEGLLLRGLEHASWVSERRPDEPVLLGITPTFPDGDLGWVVPTGPFDADSRRVAAFAEKPGPEIARQLMDRGALWNAFLIAANGRTLRALFSRHLRDLHERLTELAPTGSLATSGTQLGEAFDSLPDSDFSRELLTPAARNLRVLPVPPCGWTDLGTPARLREWLARRHAPLVLSSGST